MSARDGNPEVGELVFLELSSIDALPAAARKSWSSNPMSVVFCGDNGHGVWVRVPGATLKGQGSSSGERSDLGSFTFLIPWAFVRSIIQLEKTPSNLRRKVESI